MAKAGTHIGSTLTQGAPSRSATGWQRKRAESLALGESQPDLAAEQALARRSSVVTPAGEDLARSATEGNRKKGQLMLAELALSGITDGQEYEDAKSMAEKGYVRQGGWGTTLLKSINFIDDVHQVWWLDQLQLDKVVLGEEIDRFSAIGDIYRSTFKGDTTWTEDEGKTHSRLADEFGEINMSKLLDEIGWEADDKNAWYHPKKAGRFAAHMGLELLTSPTSYLGGAGGWKMIAKGVSGLSKTIVKEALTEGLERGAVRATTNAVEKAAETAMSRTIKLAHKQADEMLEKGASQLEVSEFFAKNLDTWVEDAAAETIAPWMKSIATRDWAAIPKPVAQEFSKRGIPGITGGLRVYSNPLGGATGGLSALPGTTGAGRKLARAVFGPAEGDTKSLLKVGRWLEEKDLFNTLQRLTKTSGAKVKIALKQGTAEGVKTADTITSIAARVEKELGLRKLFHRTAITVREAANGLKGITGDDRLVLDRAIIDSLQVGDIQASRIPFEQVGVDDFEESLELARAQTVKSGRLVGETVDGVDREAQGTRFFLSEDKMTGYAIKSDGDLVNLYNLAGGGRGEEGVRDAIGRGARKLDAFDEGGFLPDKYGKYGFEETDRAKWDSQYAPDNWAGGTPDRVYMELKANPFQQKLRTALPDLTDDQVAAATSLASEFRRVYQEMYKKMRSVGIDVGEVENGVPLIWSDEAQKVLNKMIGGVGNDFTDEIIAASKYSRGMMWLSEIVAQGQSKGVGNTRVLGETRHAAERHLGEGVKVTSAGNVTIFSDVPAERIFASHQEMNDEILGALKEQMVRKTNLGSVDKLSTALEMDVTKVMNKYIRSTEAAVKERFVMGELRRIGVITDKQFKTDVGSTLAKLIDNVAVAEDKAKVKLWADRMMKELGVAEGYVDNPWASTGKIRVEGVGELEVPSSIARLAASKRPSVLTDALNRASSEAKIAKRQARTLARDRRTMHGRLVAAGVSEGEASMLSGADALVGLRRVARAARMAVRDEARTAANIADEIYARLVGQSAEQQKAAKALVGSKGRLAREGARAEAKIGRQLEETVGGHVREQAREYQRATRVFYNQFDSPEDAAALAETLSETILGSLDGAVPHGPGQNAIRQAVLDAVNDFRASAGLSSTSEQKLLFFEELGVRLGNARKGAVAGLNNEITQAEWDQVSGMARAIIEAARAADVEVGLRGSLDAALLDPEQAWKLVNNADKNLSGAIVDLRSNADLNKLTPGQRKQLVALSEARRRVDGLIERVGEVVDIPGRDARWRDYLQSEELWEQFEVLRLLSQRKQIRGTRMRTRLETMMRDVGLIGDDARLVYDGGSLGGFAIQSETLRYHTLGQAIAEVSRVFPEVSNYDDLVRLAWVARFGSEDRYLTFLDQVGLKTPGSNKTEAAITAYSSGLADHVEDLFPAAKANELVTNAVPFTVGGEARIARREVSGKHVLWVVRDETTGRPQVLWMEQDMFGNSVHFAGRTVPSEVVDGSDETVVKWMQRQAGEFGDRTVGGRDALTEGGAKNVWYHANRVFNSKKISPETINTLAGLDDVSEATVRTGPRTPKIWEREQLSELEDAIRAGRRANATAKRQATVGAKRSEAIAAAQAKQVNLHRTFRQRVLNPLNAATATEKELDEAARVFANLLPELREGLLPMEQAQLELLDDLLGRRLLLSKLPDDPLARRIVDRAIEARKAYMDSKTTIESIQMLSTRLASDMHAAEAAGNSGALRQAGQMRDLLMEILGLDADEAGRVLSVFPSAEQEKVLSDFLERGSRMWNRLFDEGTDPFGSARVRTPVSTREGFVDPGRFNLRGAEWDSVVGDRVALEWMKDMTSQMVSLSTPEGFTQFSKYMRHVERLWKGNATVARPTFHIRNNVGAAWNNMIAGVNVFDYTKAGSVFKFLNAMRHSELEAALGEIPEASRGYFRWAWNAGVFDDTFSATEIIDSSLLKNRTFRPVGKGRYMQGAGRVMEFTEGYHRMAAFIHHMDLGADDLADAASFAKGWVDTVQFNYSDLTHFEQQAKRFVPFFVWARRNLPLQLQMLVERPAMITRYNQLMNASQANFGDDTMQDDLPPNMYRQNRKVAYVGKESFGGEDSPFWAHVVFDPDLPINQLFDLENPFSPTSWGQVMLNQLGPQFDLLQVLNSEQGDEYWVNAPGGISQTLNQLAKWMGGDISALGVSSTVEGVARQTSASIKVARTLFPALNELGGFALEQDPRRRQALGQGGITPGEGDTAREDLGAALSMMARGFGRQLQGVDDSYSTAAASSMKLDDIRRELEKRGTVTPETKLIVKSLAKGNMPEDMDPQLRGLLEQIMAQLAGEPETGSGS